MSAPEFWPDIVLERIEDGVSAMKPKTVAAAVDTTSSKVGLYSKVRFSVSLKPTEFFQTSSQGH